MPIFGKKQLKKEVVPTDVKPLKKEEVKKTTPVKTDKTGNKVERNPIIKRPRVTEKAALLAEKGIYVFEVATKANAYQIALAVRLAYKVTPTKISTMKIPSKTMFVRGKRGKTVAGKKAYVHLKKGDKIELI